MEQGGEPTFQNAKLRCIETQIWGLSNSPAIPNERPSTIPAMNPNAVVDIFPLTLSLSLSLSLFLLSLCDSVESRNVGFAFFALTINNEEWIVCQLMQKAPI